MGKKKSQKKKKESRQARAGMRLRKEMKKMGKVSVGLTGQEDIGPTSQSSKSFKFMFFMWSPNENLIQTLHI